MAASVPAMAAHLERLAKRHDVTLEFGSNNGVAYPRERLIKLRPVKSTITYGIGLHEMGHIVGSGRASPRLQCEANAWLWALRNAIKGSVDVAFEQSVRNRLRSYYEWACWRSGHIMPASIDGYLTAPPFYWTDPRPGCPAIPPEGHEFWRLLNLGMDCPDSVVAWPT